MTMISSTFFCANTLYNFLTIDIDGIAIKINILVAIKLNIFLSIQSGSAASLKNFYVHTSLNKLHVFTNNTTKHILWEEIFSANKKLKKV